MGAILPGLVLVWPNSLFLKLPRSLGSAFLSIAENVLTELVELIAVVAALVIGATKEHMSTPVGLPACRLPPPSSQKEKKKKKKQHLSLSLTFYGNWYLPPFLLGERSLNPTSGIMCVSACPHL